MIRAKIVKDTINDENGVRITTFITQTPTFIDAEIEKHRAISTNSSSSRFMPVDRFKKAAFIPDEIEAPWVDVSKMRNVDPEYAKLFQKSVMEARGYMEDCLIDFVGKVHKQHINRYFMPFSYQYKIWTATEWDNFFILRCPNEDLSPELKEVADKRYKGVDGRLCCPEMRRVASLMMKEYIRSEPEIGIYHIPLVSDEETEAFNLDEVLKMSVARCARVSFSETESNRSIEDEIKLYDKLKSNFHLSPFEHQACYPYSRIANGHTHVDIQGKSWSANFKEWVQYRKIVEKEAVK